MHRTRLHTILAVFMLSAMMLSSTGFTAIVGYCTMTHSSDCCCADDQPVGKSQPMTGVSFTDPDASCYAQSLAGGRNLIDATVHADDVTTLPVQAVLTTDSGAAIPPAPLQSTVRLFADDAAPPGVAIYLRVNSLLI